MTPEGGKEMETTELRTPAECLIHNADDQCTSSCAIGCAPGTCDCDCTDPECPVA